MIPRLCLLLLGATFAFAQDKDEKERDDEGISIDEAPAPAEPGAEPVRTTAFPAREPGKKPATVEIRQKVYSFSLPADWVLSESKEPEAELAWDILLPGSTKRASLALLRNDNLVDARSAPYRQAAWIRKDKPDEKTEVRLKPCPRVVHDRATWIDLFLYRSVRNNHYVFRLGCSPDDFPQAEADMLAAVQSFSAKVEIWPPLPKGYQVSQEGTWLIARAPSVTASLAPLVKALKQTEKRFQKDHGPLPKGDPPIVVLVHGSQGDASKIEPKVADGVDGLYAALEHRRLYATPLDKDALEREGSLAGEAQMLLFCARYGDTMPLWVTGGERTVARAESITGKPLPSLDEGFVAWVSNLRLHTLDELEAIRASKNPNWETWNPEVFFYVAMLRAGKYRKQYRAFLDDYAETADGLGAFERHFGEISQEQLRVATNEFISTKLQEVKRERKK